MKKITFLLILCLLFCAIGSIAIAEISYTFEKLDFPEDVPFDLSFVDEVFPISDEEIWMSFYGVKMEGENYLCVAKSDIDANIKEYRYLPRDWAYRLLAMKKVDDNYLIGTQSETEKEYRISYLPQKGIPEKYYELDKKFVGIIDMYAGSQGIYAYGVREEEEHYIYKLLLIDKNLELVFEKEIYRTDKSNFPGGNPFDYLLEEGNKLYLYVRKGFGWDIERFLYCLTLEGEILWRKPFENEIFVRGMKANQDGLYFYGEKGVSHAKVVSYSLEGEEKWEQNILEVERFSQGAVNNQDCFVFSNYIYDIPRKFYQIGVNGEKKNVMSINDKGFYIEFLGVDSNRNPFFISGTIIGENKCKLHFWRIKNK